MRKSERKSKHRAAIDKRLDRALSDLYHNATPRYPRVEDDKQAEFNAWFEDAASSEIDYINSGGAYAETESAYLKILKENAAHEYTSEAARRYYVRRGMRQMRGDRAKFAPWERINEYGKLYTWGRGGRTLAPRDLIRDRGPSFSPKRAEDFAELSAESRADLIRIVESFNSNVQEWCKSVPDMWREYLADNLADRCEAAILSNN